MTLGCTEINMSPISSASAVMPVTIEETDPLLPIEQWRDVDVEVTLDSGCCNHVMDTEDAPGYTVSESLGSRRGQNFVVGNGERVPNEGQMVLNLETDTSDKRKVNISSTVQVAEVSRPLMSVSKVCDQGYTCVFTKDGARINDEKGGEVYSFKRVNGLYVSNMRLRPPGPFAGPAPR